MYLCDALMQPLNLGLLSLSPSVRPSVCPPVPLSVCCLSAHRRPEEDVRPGAPGEGSVAGAGSAAAVSPAGRHPGRRGETEETPATHPMRRCY